MKMKEIVKNILTKKEIELMPTSFDTVGSIIIFNFFPEELKKKEKKIGEEIIKKLKHIETVTKKKEKYSGIYRTPIIRIIAGKKRKETIHKENGVKLKLHIEKVYFSARTAMEREKIIKQIKTPEKVLIMFSGIGPLAIEIAKHTNSEVLGIEINPKAHEYALMNNELNKENVNFKCGDVRKILPKINCKFDRILMPLPKNSEEFLGLALSKLKKNGIIQLYSFVCENELNKFKNKIKDIANKEKKRIRIVKVDKCGQFSPNQYRMRFDIKFEKNKNLQLA